MKRKLCTILVGLMLVLAASGDASAEGRRLLRGRWLFGRPMKVSLPHQQHRAPQYPRHSTNRDNPYEYYEDLYPKFYGGFHSRYFTTYGYPSGDIGIRGLPW